MAGSQRSVYRVEFAPTNSSNVACEHAMHYVITSLVLTNTVGILLFKLPSIQVIDWLAIPVRSWILEDMPLLITDNLISLGDHFLYVSCWLTGSTTFKR